MNDEQPCEVCETLARLIDGHRDGGDRHVCAHCWERGLHWPEERAKHHCRDCGRWIDGLDMCQLMEPHHPGDSIVNVFYLCREHYEQGRNQ